ncbi:hypothetical protein BC938DRAFT_481884 [Jimgerdemannia flammicorona]|uniref:Uncharacterized protein n=1 Tax=Jimgerdemannia flammicorona TaxID=994334 RepID=A0A433QWL3_9FUNG|nr:hypothetical protein BC938DRAFT_481884 [Jimgerdemannia flammicorona]
MDRNRCRRHRRCNHWRDPCRAPQRPRAPIHHLHGSELCRIWRDLFHSDASRLVCGSDFPTHPNKGVRESFLAYQRRQNPRFGLKDSQTRDADDLFSSAMAGGTTGGLLYSLVRGPKGVLPGFFVFSLLCTAGQAVYTVANRYRQSLILQSPVHEGDDAFAHEQYQPSTTTKGKWKALWDLLEVPEWSPVRRLTDEEYKAILDAKLMELEEEVEWLDRELATGGRIEASGEGEGEKG